MNRTDSISPIHADRLLAAAVVAADLAVWMFVLPFHTTLALL